MVTANRKYAFSFTALFVCLIIIYGNSFECSWHLDDFVNIVNNPNVQLKSISRDSITKTFYGKNDGHNKINRPLSYFSFAVNYYIGGDRVFGYHVLNFAIHYIAAIFLFLLIYNTLQLPLLNERYGKTAYPIALLAVFFWATHPIHVAAVTYIVQRMASMAGMFYIMSMYFYLKGRTAVQTKQQISLLALSFLAAILAIASKENAVMLPISLAVYDLFLIQGLGAADFKINLRTIVLLLLIIPAAGIYFFDLSSLLHGYDYRPFTLYERLLTEPRVIVFYLSLLFYPASSRLTLLHDVEISTSLLTPWTTLPAIFIILLLIIIALMISRKSALIAFCILFFFINHIIEGSIIPLEVIFEHRNYIPAMFIFVPLAIVWLDIYNYFSYQKPLRTMMSFTVIFLLAAQAHTTYIYNGIFRNDLTLWHDNINKAPHLHRPHHNLGNAYLKAGDDKKGLAELLIALDKKAGARVSQKFKTYFNLGTYYFYQSDYDKALTQFQKAMKYEPNYPKLLNNIAIIMLYKNETELAEKYSKQAVKTDPNSAEHRHTLSLILLKKGMADEAIKEAKMAMTLSGDNFMSSFLIGEAYRFKQEFEKALAYYKTYYMNYPDEIAINAALIELYELIRDQDALNKQVEHFVTLTSGTDINSVLIALHQKNSLMDLSRINRIAKAIKASEF